ncbi:hypothetical protein P280DRAFT_553147 [Massarina eburnea CBS 473.64]|uniref:Uncharacterized protein n=1 Tax=Massarina eburnea CBS 473.64 TaxID=1395130 RepID=A0A6A6RLA6_9PLEO|nr:hypothetical protein P280DRAFT_553147 [Massarina eburnea CBS 473.64]
MAATCNTLRVADEEQKGQRSFLDSLPEELILKIFDNIDEISGSIQPSDNNFQSKAYHPLTLVSRKFNRIATPFLYSKITYPYTSLQTVMDRHELLQDVHVLNMTNGPVNRRFMFPTRYLDHILDRISDRAQRPRIPQPTHMIRPSRFFSEAIILVVILNRTPYIREINIVDEGRWNIRPYKSIFRPVLDSIILATTGNGIGKVHTFDHLHTLKVNMGGMRISLASSLFKLKSLNHLTMVNLPGEFTDQKPERDDVWTCALGSSSVQHLRLRFDYNWGFYQTHLPWDSDKMNISASGIVSAITSCKDLRSFSTSSIGTGDGWLDVVEALLVHKHSLTALELLGTFSSALITKFPDFTTMRHIRIPLDFLCGGNDDADEEGYTKCKTPDLREVLPASLETLGLESKGYTDFSDYLEGEYRYISDSLGSKKEATTRGFLQFLDGVEDRLPNFKELWVDHKHYFLNDVHSLPLDFALVQKEFIRHGIEFGFALGIDFDVLGDHLEPRAVNPAREYIEAMTDGDYRFEAEVMNGKPLYSLAELHDTEKLRGLNETSANNLGTDFIENKKPLPCLNCIHMETSNSAVRTRLTWPDKRVRARRTCDRCDFL